MHDSDMKQQAFFNTERSVKTSFASLFNFLSYHKTNVNSLTDEQEKCVGTMPNEAAVLVYSIYFV